MLIDVMFWMLVAFAHPSGCLCAVGVRCLILLGAARRQQGRFAGADATESDSWLSGLAALLGVYFLSYVPALVLSVWVLLGQHRESSTAQLEAEMLAALPASRHSATPWIDSLLSWA